METYLARPVARWASLTAPVHGLGAGVHDEGVRQRPVAQPRQALDQLELGKRVEDVRRLHEPACLLADGLDQDRMAVAQAADGPPRHQVDVLAPVGVVQARAAPLHQHHGLARHDGDEMGASRFRASSMCIAAPLRVRGVP